MGKAVLISIRPKWCELIASGKKTIEIRKTKPKLPTPFKCYIYCTKARIPVRDDDGYIVMYEDDLAILNEWRSGIGNPCGMLGAGEEFINGTVIGEFICHNIFPLSFYASDASFFDTEPPIEVPGTCLTDKEIADYLGNGKTGYGWLISDLVIYDKPKNLSEFYRWWNDGEDIRPCQNGKGCQHLIYDYTEDCQACAIDFDGTDCPYLKVTRPPTSWCYVEEV